jgi:protein-S-isoprenylcysteine O-methyltransferase Ste14
VLKEHTGLKAGANQSQTCVNLCRSVANYEMPDGSSSFAPRDRAGVIMPPPLIYLLGLIIALLLHRVWPWPIFHNVAGRWLAMICFIGGLALAFFGRNALQRAGTNINPYRPTTAMVSSGPFRYSRNPLYLALTILFLGFTFLTNTWWGLILLGPVLLVLHWGVVLREERYLEEKFGNDYREYRRRVRRYL